MNAHPFPRVLRKRSPHNIATLPCAASLCAWLVMLATGRAVIPEPDNILYGSITLDSTPVTATRSDVLVEARHNTNGPVIASYRMGSDPSVGDFYALQLAIESGTPISNSDASGLSDVLLIDVVDATGLRARTTYTVADRGIVQRLDFGAAVSPDSDGDGLPDAWELLHFGGLDQAASAVNPNGQTTLQNYIAGTDPNNTNDVFRLTMTSNQGQPMVFFLARQAQGTGYEGRQRHYSLESASAPGGPWEIVPGFSDVLGVGQTPIFQPSVAAPSSYYRARTWLQP